MAGKWTIEWEGLEEVKAALDRFEAEAISDLTRAMDENGEHLLARSQELAPLDSGDLTGSGTKPPAKSNPVLKEVSVEVGFNKVYAARMHEDVYSPGPLTRSKPGNEAGKAGRKYLERPLKYWTEYYMSNLADALRGLTGGD